MADDNRGLRLAAGTVNDYLGRLCRELGSPPATLDAGGEASFSGTYQGTDVTVSLALRLESKTLTLMSPVGKGLEKERADAQRALLLALNLSPDDTAGMAFAMSPGDGRIYLVYSLLGDFLAFDAFRTAFLRLFGLSKLWQDQFARNPAFQPRA